MRRLRTSYVDDWEDMELTDNPRFHILGFAINPMRTLGVLVVATVALLGLLFATNLSWIAEKPWLVLTCTVVSLTGLVVIAGISVIMFVAMARVLRRSRIQLARLDGATQEEAQAESTRFIRRTVYGRMIIYSLTAVVIWVVLGSSLIFPWTTPLTYLGGVLVALVLFVLYSIYGDRIWAAWRARSKGRR